MLSVERVLRGFLLLLVNLDTKTKDELYHAPNSDVSLLCSEKLCQMRCGSYAVEMFREGLRGKACKGRASVLHLALTGEPHSPSSPARAPKLLAVRWSSPAPRGVAVALGLQPMQSAESLAGFQRQWARSSGKKTSGSNGSRSWESKIDV